MWEKKCWGRVWHIFQSDQASVSFLEVEKGWQCSRHYHEDRANFFAVVSGRIKVQVWEWSADDADGCGALHEFELGPGDTFEVLSGLVHRFQVLESGQVIEVYWPDASVRQDDIVRLDAGGLMK